jgi:hypothetical protein
MISTGRITSVFLLVSAMTMTISSVAYAANECRIQYGYNTGNSLNGTFKNKSKKIYLNKGQTKTINKNRLNYVKNLKTRNVKFYLKNASDIVLAKSKRNPFAGYYVGATVKLKKVKCLSSYSSCNPVYPDVAKVPAPPGPPIPIPYPGVKCK